MEQIMSASQIQYTLISNENSLTATFFGNSSLRLLRQLPRDLLQLEDVVNLFEISKRYLMNKGVDIYHLPSNMFMEDVNWTVETFLEYSKQFNKSIVKVFIIDANIDNHEHVSTFINSLDHAYFSIIEFENENISLYDQENRFNNVFGFLELLNRDKKEIIESLKQVYPKTEFNPWNINKEKWFFENNIWRNNLLHDNNFYVLNQIIGNFWKSGYDYLDKEYIAENQSAANERTKILIEQVNTIDNVIYTMLETELLKVVSGSNPFLSPLILLAPFHFPLSKTFKKKLPTSKKIKAITQLLKVEQSKDYNFLIERSLTNTLNSSEINYSFDTIKEKISFIDNVGYLHAQLSYSPVIRLPIIGKSINSYLSYFNKYISNKNKYLTIEKFGRKLKERILNDDLCESISNRNGQIVVISDLPIEWMYLDEYPLSFTHDVCRIPEFNQNSIVNNYIQSQRFCYSIPDGLISRTLVIHCASKDDNEMQKMFRFIDCYKDELKFNIAHCSTIVEIKEAIDLYNPDFLIFDSHGGFDETTLSSYLIVDFENNIRLTGDEVVEYGISAPLVFLSACTTMPNYGYVRFISDAFMEAGAFSVTATYLPLSIAEAGKLIIRVLSKLKYLQGKVIHSNWLEFISHVLRTSLIHEIVLKEVKSEVTLNSKQVHELSEILAQSMLFEKRKECLETLNDFVRKYSEKKEFNFSNIDNEWLSYTILGRADLLYFENWRNAHREKNGL